MTARRAVAPGASGSVDGEPSGRASVNALRVKHPRGVASLPVVPVTPPGRILGVALLADTLPGSIGLDAPAARVTASLSVRWALAPDAAADDAPARATLRRVAGHDPYLAIDGRVRTARGRLVASTLALFASVPRPDDIVVEEHAGQLSADLVGAELDAAVVGEAGLVELRPAWRNRLGLLHGAVGSALLALAASRSLMDREAGDDGGSFASTPDRAPGAASDAAVAAWPRIVDAHVRFLRPVTGDRLGLEVAVLRRSERSADVDVRATVAGEGAILGRYLLAVPVPPRVR